MSGSSNWCPLCSYSAERNREQRVICAVCQGTGEARCPACICLECAGTGFIGPRSEGGEQTSCPACSGVGHVPGCSMCNSKGSVPCRDCFGSGLAPSPGALEFAGGGPLASLLGQLPVSTGGGEEAAAGELLDQASTLRRILCFLGSYHWAPIQNSADAEHELHVLDNRLHLRTALLSFASVSSIRIDYRFLTVWRCGESAFRVSYQRETKAWR